MTNSGILNVVSSLLRNYNIKSEFQPVECLEKNTRKNLIFFIFDGLGYNLLQNSNCEFLKKNTVEKIKTIFPTTTTSVMTSIYTCSLPIEHQLIGWSIYFKEYFRLIDVLPKNDSITREQLGKDYYLLNSVPDENIFSKIKKANPETDVFHLTIKGFEKSDYTKKVTKPAQIVTYENFSEIENKLNKIIDSNAKEKFVFVYSSLPDHEEHEHGVHSNQVKIALNQIETLVKSVHKTHGKNSQMIITSDHGLLDTKILFINDDKEFYDSIILPPFPETRFFTVFIKDEKKKSINNVFKKYRKDFEILTKKEFINGKYLGDKIVPTSNYDLIGDYVFIAKSNVGLKMNFKIGENKILKGYHTGLTDDELYVPLITL